MTSATRPLTITVPRQIMREQLSTDLTDAERAQVRIGVWSGATPTADLPLDEVDVAVIDGDIPGLADHLGKATRLRYLQSAAAGLDGVANLIGPDVMFMNGAGLHDAETAEMAVGLMLAAIRGIDDFARAMPSGQWLQSFRPALVDSSVLIVGAGRIGNALYDRLIPFEVELTRVARTARTDERGRVHSVSELPQLLPTADVVALVLPATAETKQLADEAFLAAMKDGALLVNVGRGAVVDQEALLAELTRGRLRAALDVMTPEPLPPDHPLWRAPGLLISPHVAGNTRATFPRLRRLIARQVKAILAGGELVNVVQGPHNGPTSS